MEEFKNMVLVVNSTQCFKVLNNKPLHVSIACNSCNIHFLKMHLTKNAQIFLKCVFKCNQFVM